MLLGWLRIAPCSHCESFFDWIFSGQTLPYMSLCLEEDGEMQVLQPLLDKRVHRSGGAEVGDVQRLAGGGGRAVPRRRAVAADAHSGT